MDFSIIIFLCLIFGSICWTSQKISNDKWNKGWKDYCSRDGKVAYEKRVSGEKIFLIYAPTGERCWKHIAFNQSGNGSFEYFTNAKGKILGGHEYNKEKGKFTAMSQTEVESRLDDGWK